MTCTEDDEYYQPGHEWLLYNCSLLLTDVILTDEYKIVCDIIVDGQTYYEEMLDDGTTYTYGAYTITCYGFIGTNGEKLAQITICTEEEANQILTLYFKPYPWSSNCSAASMLTSISEELAISLEAAFYAIPNNEYISHEIVVEKPEFSGIDLVGVRIYVYSTESPTSLQAIFGGVGIFLILAAIAILGCAIDYVGNIWQEILAVWTYKYPITVQESSETYSELTEVMVENWCYEVNNGTLSPDEFIVLLRDLSERNHAHRNMISPKNSLVADNEFDERIESAIVQYGIDGNFDALCASSLNAAQTRGDDDKTETGNNYEPGEVPDLSSDIDKAMEYLMYGGIAIGGIMLGTMGIQLMDTIKK